MWRPATLREYFPFVFACHAAGCRRVIVPLLASPQCPEGSYNFSTGVCRGAVLCFFLLCTVLTPPAASSVSPTQYTTPLSTSVMIRTSFSSCEPGASSSVPCSIPHESLLNRFPFVLVMQGTFVMVPAPDRTALPPTTAMPPSHPRRRAQAAHTGAPLLALTSQVAPIARLARPAFPLHLPLKPVRLCCCGGASAPFFLFSRHH